MYNLDPWFWYSLTLSTTLTTPNLSFPTHTKGWVSQSSGFQALGFHKRVKLRLWLLTLIAPFVFAKRIPFPRSYCSQGLIQAS